MTKAVAVQSTELITSLVARQRSRTEPRNNPVRRPRSREKREPAKPVPQMNSDILRGRITKLLYAYKDGIVHSKFSKAFAMRFGQYIRPANYGFMDLTKLLESMNDIIDAV